MSNIFKRSTASKAKSSVVSEVEMSGLRLVRQRKMRGRPATMRDLAAAASRAR